MVKVDKETAERNRQDLVQAADRVARRDGLMRAALIDIAREAGLTSGAVYARFSSRESLLAAGMDAGFARMIAWIGTFPDAAAYVRALRESGREADNTLKCPAISHAGVIRFGSPQEQEAYRSGLAAMIEAICDWPDIADERAARRLLAGVMGAAMLENALPEDKH